MRLMAGVTRCLLLCSVLLMFSAAMFSDMAMAACAAFQFYFARGTNERYIPRPGTNDKVTYGFGEVGWDIWDKYSKYPIPAGGATAFPAFYKDFIVEPLNSLELLEALKEMWNQATDPGGQDCIDGIEVCPAVSALREQLFQAALDCPGSKFVFVGYSYGAMVIQRYMHLVPNPDGFDGDLTIGRNKVVAVLLYGDPTWPQRPEFIPLIGLATSYDLGFRQLEDYIPKVPKGINERFQSWCLSYDLGPPTVDQPYTAYDPICLANPLDVDENFLNCFVLGAPEIQCPHRQYIQQGLTQMGADWLATIIGVK